MLRAIPGTLLVALTFVLASAALVGLGLAIRRLFGLRELEPEDGFVAPWIGFAAVLLFLLVWNFAFPVDGRALSLVLLGGAGGLLWSRRELAALLAAHPVGRPRWALAAIVLLGLWIANLATGPMTNWDTSLYHMQGVRWAAEHPAVPGLANLFGPLAFNNATFLYGALLDAGPWEGQAWHVANGILVFLSATTALACGVRFLRTHDAGDLLTFLTLAPVLNLAVGEHLRSFVPDVGLTLTRLTMIAIWFRLLVRQGREARVEAYDVVCLVALSAAGVAIKMNAVIFASLTVLAASVLWLRRGGHPPGLRLRTAAWCVAIGLAFGVAWAGRGVVLSGYPAFPSQMLAAPVEWRAPAEHAYAEFVYVVHSTRSSTGNVAYVAGRTHGLGAWLPNWLGHLPESPFYLIVPIAASLVLLPFLLARAPARAPPAAWWILGPATIALIAWFVVAPAPRYMTAVFWAFPMLFAAQAHARFPLQGAPAWNRRIFGAALLLGLSPIVIVPLAAWRLAGAEGNPVMAVLRASAMLPPPGQLMRGARGAPVLRTYQTQSGLTLNVPESRCWYAPLPCTPNPAPNLRLRRPGNLDAGFMVTGGWQMRDWPEPWKAKYRAAYQESIEARPVAP